MIKKFENFNEVDPFGEEKWEDETKEYDYIKFDGNLIDFLEQWEDEYDEIANWLDILKNRNFMAFANKKIIFDVVKDAFVHVGVNDEDSFEKIQDDIK
jgi:hypothetical protein